MAEINMTSEVEAGEELAEGDVEGVLNTIQ